MYVTEPKRHEDGSALKAKCHRRSAIGHANAKQTEAYLDELDNASVDEAFRRMDQ